MQVSSSPLPARDAPIGVFDSGVGGLTVLRALVAAMPGESFVYLGDTARLPYGTKSAESVRRYALQAADALHARGVKCLVVACNTASAVALDALAGEFSPVPVIGVIEPGAEAACRATRCGRIAVIATEGTVRGAVYERAILRRLPAARVVAQPCPLFVALAEEGLTDGPIVEAIAHRYLDGIFEAVPAPQRPDTLVLGCTHFPVLAGALQPVVGAGVTIVDSARTTAAAVLHELGRRVLLRGAADGVPTIELLATDDADRFARVGAGFLGREIRSSDVSVVDL